MGCGASSGTTSVPNLVPTVTVVTTPPLEPPAANATAGTIPLERPLVQNAGVRRTAQDLMPEVENPVIPLNQRTKNFVDERGTRSIGGRGGFGVVTSCSLRRVVAAKELSAGVEGWMVELKARVLAREKAREEESRRHWGQGWRRELMVPEEPVVEEAVLPMEAEMRAVYELDYAMEERVLERQESLLKLESEQVEKLAALKEQHADRLLLKMRIRLVDSEVEQEKLREEWQREQEHKKQEREQRKLERERARQEEERARLERERKREEEWRQERARRIQEIERRRREREERKREAEERKRREEEARKRAEEEEKRQKEEVERQARQEHERFQKMHAEWKEYATVSQVGHFHQVECTHGYHGFPLSQKYNFDYVWHEEPESVASTCTHLAGMAMQTLAKGKETCLVLFSPLLNTAVSGESPPDWDPTGPASLLLQALFGGEPVNCFGSPSANRGHGLPFCAGVKNATVSALEVPHNNLHELVDLLSPVPHARLVMQDSASTRRKNKDSRQSPDASDATMPEVTRQPASSAEDVCGLIEHSLRTRSTFELSQQPVPGALLENLQNPELLRSGPALLPTADLLFTLNFQWRHDTTEEAPRMQPMKLHIVMMSQQCPVSEAVAAYWVSLSKSPLPMSLCELTASYLSTNVPFESQQRSLRDALERQHACGNGAEPVPAALSSYLAEAVGPGGLTLFMGRFPTLASADRVSGALRFCALRAMEDFMQREPVKDIGVFASHTSTPGVQLLLGQHDAMAVAASPLPSADLLQVVKQVRAASPHAPWLPHSRFDNGGAALHAHCCSFIWLPPHRIGLVAQQQQLASLCRLTEASWAAAHRPSLYTPKGLRFGHVVNDTPGDFQLALTTTELQELLGRECVDTLFATLCFGPAALSTSSCGGRTSVHEQASEWFRCSCGSADEATIGKGALQLRVRLRRVEATVAPRCINFHLDHSVRTLQVAINEPQEYDGGRIVYVAPDRQGHDRSSSNEECTTTSMLRWSTYSPERVLGSATLHDHSVVHGVTPVLRGIRYSLFLLLQCPAV